MKLKLPVHCEEAIRRLARDSYPHECCGFLLGTDEAEGREVCEARAALNENSSSPRNRFLITPKSWADLERELLGSSLSLLGFFHSHPDHPARPSQFDLDHAWPWYSYLIVSVSATETLEMTSWRLKDDRSGYQQETLVGRAASEAAPQTDRS